jgi:hypothetical protein
VSVNQDGTIHYEPDPDYFKGPNDDPDSFTYNLVGSNDPDATVSIIVHPVNDAPVAFDDEYSVNWNQVLSVDVATGGPGVLANDTDVENDPLTAVLVTSVSNGTSDPQ